MMPPRQCLTLDAMEKFCALSQGIGNDEECPRAWCAFWEHGGAVAEPGCAIERMGLDLGNIDLAHYLLDLRRALDGASNEAESRIARERMAELVPPDLSGS
jgi:hypothetical protein